MPRGNGGIIGPVNTSFSGVWSLTEAQLRRSANTWPNFYAALLSESATGSDAVTGADTADPYFEYTTLLLPGNGTNGATNNAFLDSSGSGVGNPTRSGNTTQGTFSPFSQTGWGNYLTTTSYLQTPSNANFAFGTGDYTVEGWFYSVTTTANLRLFHFSDDLDNVGINYTSTGTIAYYNGSTNTVSGTTPFTPNQWNHVAVVRSSGTVKIYVNGTSALTQGTTPNTTASRSLGITSTAAGSGSGMSGYMSNIRVVKGTAVYTSNFTPPTTPLTAISGTQLLTAQSNRFVDNSSNGATLTTGGGITVVSFSPFNPTSSWSAATNGGSGYFDGNGDYLDIATNAAFDFGTGDFTIECWAYLTTSSNAFSAIISCFNIAGANPSWCLGFSNTTNQMAFFPSYFSPAVTFSYSSYYNTWTHIAVTRSGTSLRLFANGALVSSTTDSTAVSTGSKSLRIGSRFQNDSQYLINGYISNLRIVKGTAVYTAAFTPPTAPVTNITNTSLLLNFTNAGIYDATSKNDLETVGNAQISTAISAKWGSGSIYLDGTNSRFNFSPANLFILGTAAFTFETWFYPVAAGGSGTIFTCKLSGGRGFYLVWSTGSVLRLLVNAGTNWNVDISSSALTLNTWHHIAVTRSGSTFYLLADGSLANSQGGVSGEICSTVPIVKIGSDDANGSLMTQSYLQDTRFTNGIARYTGAYTVPTAAFPTL